PETDGLDRRTGHRRGPTVALQGVRDDPGTSIAQHPLRRRGGHLRGRQGLQAGRRRGVHQSQRPAHPGLRRGFMTLWGGRFEGSPDERTWEYTVDRSDGRMIAEDIEASIAHASMLGATGIIPPDDAGEIVRGLRLIRDEVTNGSFEYRESDEDIHSAVERRLFDLIGPVAGKLHTGRSRNDQV